MFAALAKLSITKDPAQLCALVGEAMNSDSTIAAGVLAAVESNSAAVREKFIALAGFNDEQAEIVRALPFLFVPAGEREVGLIFTEERRGQWGIHDISQLRAAVLRGASADPYQAAVARQQKPQLRVVG